MSYSPVLFRRLFQRKEPIAVRASQTSRKGMAGIEPAKGVVSTTRRKFSSNCLCLYLCLYQLGYIPIPAADAVAAGLCCVSKQQNVEGNLVYIAVLSFPCYMIAQFESRVKIFHLRYIRSP